MPVRVPFSVLWRNYPQPSTDPTAQLYRNFGWDDLVGDQKYENTCAIRMSVALSRSGVALPKGELKIWKGPLKGRRIKIRYDDLATYLKQLWGPPRRMMRPSKSEVLALGDGIVVFFGLPGGYPGHIDLLDVSRTDYQIMLWRWSTTSGTCGTSCYFGAREVWHWPAK